MLPNKLWVLARGGVEIHRDHALAGEVFAEARVHHIRVMLDQPARKLVVGVP